jgi:hypothetical protein
MEADFAFLTDCAEVVNGKLYIMGGCFDTIYARSLPFVYRPFSFVMRLEMSPAELDRKHKIEVHVLDEDGRRIASVGGDLEVSRNPTLPRGRPQGFLNVMNFANFKFDKLGDYSFEIMANGSSIKSVRFRVTESPQSRPMPTQ